jgi:UDP-N-acetylglucosamine acyltransferase
MIDAKAVVDPRARLDPSVEVGPFTLIGPDVEIGPNCIIGAHVSIKGPTRMGTGNRIYPFASIGDDPQDKKFHGEKTWLYIGERNTIREYTTINRGTGLGGGETRIGNDNWIMAYVHIAHDCIVGNHVIMANTSALAGHVRIDDHAGIGAFSKVYQFCHVGRHAFLAYESGVLKDVAPYMMVFGSPAKLVGINKEGLKRAGFTTEQVGIIRKAHRIIYRNGLCIDEVVQQLRQELHDYPDLIAPIIELIENSKNGIAR